MKKQINIEVPAVFEELWHPATYKVYCSGRGAAKSWTFARVLICKSFHILCCREVQKTIDQSVYRLLVSQIHELGFAPYFKILKTAIINKVTGTSFTFAGLRDARSAEGIRSFEGVKICWVEEAHAVVKESIDVLLPTIRKPGSEIWFSLNARFPTDPVWQMFFAHPDRIPDDTVAHRISWRDNFAFPDKLRAQMSYDKEYFYTKYMHVWEGEPMTTEGRVIKRKWLKRWGLEEKRSYDMVVFSLDTSYSEKTSADYSVISVWGFEPNNLDLLEIRRGQWNFPDLLKNTKEIYDKYQQGKNSLTGSTPIGQMLIEKKASGESLAQVLRAEGYEVKMVNPKNDKVQRLHLASPHIIHGNLRIPVDGFDGWVEPFIAEVVSFSDDMSHPFDDQVDAMTQAVLSWRATYGK